MCGRYYFSIDLGNLSFVENIDGFSFKENFNIAPQTSVPVVIDNKLKECTWGYYPQWLKDQSNSRPLFNTRFESLLEKKTFISAFKKSRCLVPISGWYEWKVVDEGKQPYFFKNNNDENLLAAGLYWDRSDGSTEFSIITTAHLLRLMKYMIDLHLYLMMFQRVFGYQTMNLKTYIQIYPMILEIVSSFIRYLNQLIIQKTIMKN